MAERTIRRETTIPAAPEAVWAAWTTVEGVRTFFAPEARIACAPGGAYEMYFDLEAPPGSRGSEGCSIVALEPGRRLVITWNFPRHLPTLIDQKTEVELLFSPLEGGTRTRLSMEHRGWNDGGEWDDGYAYFDRVWDVVLDRLRRRFEAGPIDWTTI